MTDQQPRYCIDCRWSDTPSGLPPTKDTLVCVHPKAAKNCVDRSPFLCSQHRRTTQSDGSFCTGYADWYQAKNSGYSEGPLCAECGDNLPNHNDGCSLDKRVA